MNFLIDTNIAIYYLKGLIPQESVSLLREIFSDFYFISTVTHIELLGWHKLNKKEEDQIRKLLKNSRVIYINEEIENKTIEFKKIKRIKLPDAIIAATASIYNLMLITRNEKDFKGLPVNILNPFDV